MERTIELAVQEVDQQQPQLAEELASVESQIRQTGSNSKPSATSSTDS
ncbi:MAG: hypothetical protein M3P83_08165 [Actinomycetota bacterium]|nr:hypothetical protein [Actinomycetota bacterium]